MLRESFLVGDVCHPIMSCVLGKCRLKFSVCGENSGISENFALKQGNHQYIHKALLQTVFFLAEMQKHRGFMVEVDEGS